MPPFPGSRASRAPRAPRGATQQPPSTHLRLLCIIGAAFAVTPAAAAALAGLPPIERLLLSDRLGGIRTSVRRRFGEELRPRLLGAAEAGGSIPNFTVIFPGAGGRDGLSNELDGALAEEAAAAAGAGPPPLVTTFDWGEHRGTLLTAAFDAEGVGEAVGGALAGLWGAEEGGAAVALPPASVHCVGISVGAFAAHGMAAELGRLLAGAAEGGGVPPPYVRLTLLDPFTSRGVLGAGYGAANFGRGADYAVQYMNTDDPVPSTNEPLPLCVCYDVTGAAARSAFALPEGESMHCWPVAYLARHLRGRPGGSGSGTVRHGDGTGLERGTVVKVE